jgi:hypothetical protein
MHALRRGRPHAQARYFFHDFGRFRLKWECHTEFATYTFVERASLIRLAIWPCSMPLQHVPQEWLAGLHGKIIVAAHVLLCKGTPTTMPARPPSANYFRASRWSAAMGQRRRSLDRLPDPARWLQPLRGARPAPARIPAGRLVGRLLEIETYRMMALLGLPQAEATQPALNGIENELAELTATLVKSDQTNGDQAMLEQACLPAWPRNWKKSRSTTATASPPRRRISVWCRRASRSCAKCASKACPRWPNSWAAGWRRRHTCTSVAQRQELAKRIARTNDLLRTRVGIEQEQQNRKILQSLDARAAQQLRLQQAVEGLSVAAISYYTLGLVGYVGQGHEGGHAGQPGPDDRHRRAAGDRRRVARPAPPAPSPRCSAKHWQRIGCWKLADPAASGCFQIGDVEVIGIGHDFVRVQLPSFSTSRSVCDAARYRPVRRAAHRSAP